VSIILQIPFEPVGKPRMIRSDKWKRRPAVVRYWKYKAKLQEAALKAGIDLAVAPLEVRVNCDMPMPGLWSRKKKAEYAMKFHRQKPDIDNTCKAILDSLWKQDQKIAIIYFAKRWNYTGHTRIEIVY